MPPSRRRALAASMKALLHDPDLVRIAPVLTALRILGRRDLDFRFEFKVDHRLGLIIAAKTSSDGLCRLEVTHKSCGELIHPQYLVLLETTSS